MIGVFGAEFIAAKQIQHIGHFGSVLIAERAGAGKVKQEKPILVILGNRTAPGNRRFYFVSSGALISVRKCLKV